MLSFATTIEIARPVDEVFAYIEDFTNVPTWNHWVREVHRITPGPIGVGTVFHQIRRDDEQRYHIVGHQVPREVVVATLHGTRPAFTRSMEMHPAPTGTRLIDSWELDTGHPPLVQKLAAYRVRDGVAENLSRLKELLETGRTVLPDGRRVAWSGRDNRPASSRP